MHLTILKQLRTQKGIYQKDLADYLHVSIATVSSYEHGVHNPDLDTLCRLADYYETSIDYILGRTNYPFLVTEPPNQS